VAVPDRPRQKCRSSRLRGGDGRAQGKPSSPCCAARRAGYQIARIFTVGTRPQAYAETQNSSLAPRHTESSILAFTTEPPDRDLESSDPDKHIAPQPASARRFAHCCRGLPHRLIPEVSFEPPAASQNSTSPFSSTAAIPPEKRVHGRGWMKRQRSSLRRLIELEQRHRAVEAGWHSRGAAGLTSRRSNSFQSQTGSRWTTRMERARETSCGNCAGCNITVVGRGRQRPVEVRGGHLPNQGPSQGPLPGSQNQARQQNEGPCWA